MPEDVHVILNYNSCKIWKNHQVRPLIQSLACHESFRLLKKYDFTHKSNERTVQPQPMSTLKSVVMVVMFLSVPLAGCLDSSSGDDGDHSVDVSELEERIDQLNSTLNELNESIIFLKNGWSDANITILELGQNLSQSDAVIASMLQGWDASNQTILELRQAWDQSNNSQSETIPIAPPGMNQTLLELQNQIDQAHEEITYLKNG